MPANNRFAALSAASFIALSLSAPLATAQEAETVDVAAKEEATLRIQPVVVTALKRETTLQDTPAAITAFSAEALEDFDIDSITDISRVTPNFLATNFSDTQPIFAIRGGANTLGALGTNEPVAVFIDEVFIPRPSAGDIDLFDLQSVEVLRGPQGTFFGRNVASGAIILRTAEPSLDEFTAKGQIGFGNLSAFEARGAINGPITDTLAGKFSVSYEDRDGYGRDILTGQEQNGFNATGVRGALRWAPNAQFDAVLSADYQHDENTGRTISTIDVQDDGDRRTSAVGVPQAFERDIFGLSLRASYETDAGEFLSITGYRQSDAREDFSFNGLSYTLLPFGFQQVNTEIEKPQTWSQEFRFTSDYDGPLNVIAGVYYLSEDSEAATFRQRRGASTGAVTLSEIYLQGAETEAYAVYADATYEVTPTVELSGGLRYTSEERTGSLDFRNLNNASANFNAQGLSEDFDAVTPRAVITWRPNEDLTLYGSYSEGFTAGGFNTTDDSLAEFEQPFEEEKIKSFEIGARTFFADGRGYLNVTAFDQSYEGKQEFVFNRLTFFGTVENAADATIQGIEFEAGWQFNDYFSVDATYGYLNTEFDSFEIPGSAGNTGNRLGNSPENQYSIAAQAWYPVRDGKMEVFGNANYGWTGQYFSGAGNEPDLSVEEYGLFNAVVGLRSADDRWQVELFGSNLFDEEYVQIPSNFIVDAEVLGPPRLYGVRLTASY